MLDGVDFDVALGQRGGAVGFADVFHARLDFRFAFEVHAAEAHAAVGGRGQDGHVHPVAAVQADAGKTGGTIERLLVEHRQIRQNARAVGKYCQCRTGLRMRLKSLLDGNRRADGRTASPTGFVIVIEGSQFSAVGVDFRFHSGLQVVACGIFVVPLKEIARNDFLEVPGCINDVWGKIHVNVVGRIIQFGEGLFHQFNRLVRGQIPFAFKFPDVKWAVIGADKDIRHIVSVDHCVAVNEPPTVGQFNFSVRPAFIVMDFHARYIVCRQGPGIGRESFWA